MDRTRVEANCTRMREKARQSRVAFRPHVKTHKTAEIARMQHGGEQGSLTVSTMAEAEFFAGHGCRDITYAVPIAPEKLERAAALSSRIHLNLLIDHPDAFQAIEQFANSAGARLSVFLKVDCGYHRAGVDPDDPASLELARRMTQSKAVNFEGLLTHAGHSYRARTVDEIRRIADEESGALTRFREKLGSKLFRSIGSTPTASIVEKFENCDEVRPGNYVFYDAFQATIGACRLEDCAVSVLTSVIGAYPSQNKLMVDAGALALSKDLGPNHLDETFGYGLVCDTSLRPLKMKITSISQEHGQVFGEEKIAFERFPVGSRLRIIPNHSCLTAALYDRYHVVQNDRIMDEWTPVRGW